MRRDCFDGRQLFSFVDGEQAAAKKRESPIFFSNPDSQRFLSSRKTNSKNNASVEFKFKSNRHEQAQRVPRAAGAHLLRQW